MGEEQAQLLRLLDEGGALQAPAFLQLCTVTDGEEFASMFTRIVRGPTR
ncbi:MULTISPECIES: hypothetical protein [unclassified Streptomyces]